MDKQCFNCSSNVEITEKTIFCPFCITQIICKICGEPLVKGAIGCGSCGSTISLKENQQERLNEIEFEQKGDSKKFKAIFTDNVGHDLVNTFGGMIGIAPQKKKTLGYVQSKSPINFQIQNREEIIEEAEELEEDDLTEMLKAVFRIDGDGLTFQTANFKAKTSINKAIRVALLTLLGYKFLHNTEDIKRVKLTDVLKRFKLNSGNFRTWINKSEEIGQNSGGMIFLTPNGLSTAIEVLKEVVNPNISEGLVDFSKSKNKKKRNNKEDGAEVKRSGKSPKEYILKIINDNFFNDKRSVAEIIDHLKVNHASTFQWSQIGTTLGRLVNEGKLKREKGASNSYVYFI